MKATIVTNEVFFEPIKIELVIETPEDLYNLLIRLNESAAVLNRRDFDSAGMFDDYPKHVLADDSLNDLWNQLDDIAIERGLTSDIS